MQQVSIYALIAIQGALHAQELFRMNVQVATLLISLMVRNVWIFALIQHSFMKIQ